jgi:hypothetical protein
MRILRIRLYIKGESYNNDRESRSESTRGDMREISVCISAIYYCHGVYVYPLPLQL